ncbi:MAG TPA: MerR family transcriptional regulator [Ktedonobacterales bacterium]|nr:MerR family transcriptional regulator [Ktedonobacterales bacterium]
MLEEEQTLTIEELAERAETSVRTIRFYIAEGLLPGPGARGKAASYSGDHLQRLRLIRRLAEQRVPLAEMREMLARLSPGDEQALLNEEEERAMQREQAAQSTSPKDYLATLLHQARAARQPPSAQPSAATSFPAAPAPAAKLPPQPIPGLPSRPIHMWQRWELAPGVELHVRADVAAQQRQLIERLLWAAGPPDQKSR